MTCGRTWQVIGTCVSGGRSKPSKPPDACQAAVFCQSMDSVTNIWGFGRDYAGFEGFLLQ